MTEQTGSTFPGTQVRRSRGGPQVAAHRLELAVESGPDAGAVCELSGARITVGTASDNDLRLTDPTVSRRHFEVEARDREYVLRDLGSTNGTQVGPALVREAVLLPDAEIRAGETVLTFRPRRKWITVTEASSDHFGGLIGRSPAMRQLFGLLECVAPARLSCLVLGPTGSGKEVTARAIHEHSTRATGPFVVFDAASAAASLIESELFGHERGAFTGADRQRPGVFELAHGGTLFIDEIGELPLELQPRLLRALEQRTIRRVGGTESIEVDVRILAATHRPLTPDFFREDLSFRIAEVVIELPPLRERRDDVALLAFRFLDEAIRAGSPVRTIDQSALDWLAKRRWPGNVRQLRNTLRSAFALMQGDSLTARELEELERLRPAVPGEGFVGSLPSLSGLTLDEARKRLLTPMETSYLEQLLERHHGDLNAAADEAGIHRKSLLRLLRRHGFLDG